MESFLIAIVLLALVAAFVSVPLRRKSVADADPLASERAELEARKEAKYREIRDTAGDHASGKLSDEDFRRLDRDLRGEAIAILKRIDKLESLH
jgi:hypothetical protein